jgi:hypothetical protein
VSSYLVDFEMHEKFSKTGDRERVRIFKKNATGDLRKNLVLSENLNFWEDCTAIATKTMEAAGESNNGGAGDYGYNGENGMFPVNMNFGQMHPDRVQGMFGKGDYQGEQQQQWGCYPVGQQGQFGNQSGQFGSKGLPAVPGKLPVCAWWYYDGFCSNYAMGSCTDKYHGPPGAPGGYGMGGRTTDALFDMIEGRKVRRGNKGDNGFKGGNGSGLNGQDKNTKGLDGKPPVKGEGTPKP